MDWLGVGPGEGPKGVLRLSSWFPGEMARTRSLIKQHLPLVGLVIEVADARAPRATRFPGLTSLVAGRPLLSVLGKADLAAPSVTARWTESLRASLRPGDSVVTFSGGRGSDGPAIAAAAADTGRASSSLGPVRAMVVGLPNVGKSTLINRLVGRASARTGDRPGITRGKQWLRAGSRLELLDLPGMLVPGRIPGRVAVLLALVGVLPEEAFDPVAVAQYALGFLARRGRLPDELLPVPEAAPGAGGTMALLERFAIIRGHLSRGGRTDLERAAATFVRDFRAGRFGRLSLEVPQAPGEESLLT